jgi:hypothetical protein
LVMPSTSMEELENVTTKLLSNILGPILKRESVVAQKNYETLILHISKKSLNGSIGNNINDKSIIDGTGVELSSKQIMAGQYQLTIVGLDEFGTFTDHKVIGNVKLLLMYIRAVSTFALSTRFNHRGRLSITGYTSCMMNINTKDAFL